MHQKVRYDKFVSQPISVMIQGMHTFIENDARWAVSVFPDLLCAEHCTISLQLPTILSHKTDIFGPVLMDVTYMHNESVADNWYIITGTSTAESSVSGVAACDQDLIDAASASTFVISRDIKYTPLRVRQDAAVPYHYCKQFPTVCVFLQFL